MIQRGWQLALLLAALAFFAATTAFFFPFTADDSYIVARYAVNARDRGEWVFNAGEHVTAMTSPVHGMLLVGLSFLADDPLQLYKVVAVALVTGSFAWLLARYGVRRREAIPLAAVLTAPSVVLWMAAGLETPLLAAIVAIIAGLLYMSESSSARSFFVVAALTGLAAITRYDSVLFVGPVFLAALLQPRRAWTERVGAMAVAAVVPLVWFLFSLQKFGAILPTSFYIKTPTGDLNVVTFNVSYMAEHLAIAGLAVLALYSAARVLSTGSAVRAVADEVRARWGLHLGIAAVLAYGATMATVHMMFAFRHFMPYLAPTALAVVLFTRRSGDKQLPVQPQGMASPPPPLGLWAETAAVVAILAVHALHAQALYGRSLQGLGSLGEYASQGMLGYTRDFIPAMRRNAVDVRAHWDALQMGRPPRIWTFAAGALPYEYRDAYIYEELVSFRHRCPANTRGDRPDSRLWRAHADYIHAFTRHGSLNRLLAPVRVRQVELISKQTLHFNGRDEELLVYYNPAARPHVLPPAIDDPCVTESSEH